MIMKKLKLFIIGIIICFMLLWVGSIARCEILTYFHWKEFETLYEATNMLGNPEYLKVLNYSNTFARIYYYNEEGGDILTFIKKGNQWVYDQWERTVWSRTGSADGFMWPYVR